jgi:hypothetical protein
VTLYYAIVSEEICSNIETLIQSKYVGEFCTKTVSITGRRELRFTSSGDREAKFDHQLCEKVIYAYVSLIRMKSKTLRIPVERIYVYKDLQESDFAFIMLSMKIFKIFSYDENDKQDIELIFECNLSHRRVLDFLKQAKYYERSAKVGIAESTQVMEKNLLCAREELKLAKESMPGDFLPTQFISAIDAAIESPKILTRSRKLVDLYFAKHQALTMLRYQK